MCLIAITWGNNTTHVQAVEPSALIPLKFDPRAVILVGDPEQVRSTTYSCNFNLLQYYNHTVWLWNYVCDASRSIIVTYTL
jgi:hypothetical protein